MRDYTPLFAHLFSIREWEMDRLTHAGFEAYRGFADQWMKARSGDGK